jgi:uncharacterized protein
MRHALLALLVLSSLGLAAWSVSRPAEDARQVIVSKPEEDAMSLPTIDEIAALPPDGGEQYNRLIHEHSPYLLQHARNPVDWYPWGDEAFARALEEDRPIFLSIGYATCHWCHVMEHESFEDAEVAALLNEHFVCIKVDREERPDVDHVYMTVAQMMTGSGGWPLTVVLTPDREPYFTGTYFPKVGMMGRPGMVELVPALARAWHEERAAVRSTAHRAVDALKSVAEGMPGDGLDRASLEAGYQRLAGSYDARYGGFGSAPKFPSPHQLSFLLRYGHRSGDARATEMAHETLLAMRRGGIFDHVGLGFHRYSTDAQWLVPHFEKMLYDQALLALASLETWQATGDDRHARTAREIFEYVQRDMTSPEGGFYSAEDADSEGEEGAFYLWTTDEIREVLEPRAADLFIAAYGIEERGNFHDEASGSLDGRNIPHLRRPLVELAPELSRRPDELAAELEHARAALFEVRERRVHPLKDDKILTDWNGLMIAAFARGGAVLDEPAYTEVAIRAADFVLTTLRDDDGDLLKRYRRGEAGLEAHLDDHAFMVWGLLELYEATFDERWLAEAIQLNERMLEQFWDDQRGGLFLTADDAEQVLVRSKEFGDGAIPSGNSVAALNMLRIARITASVDLERRAQALFRATSGAVDRMPDYHAQLLTAAAFAVGPSFEVVIAGDRSAEDTQTMVSALRGNFLPGKVVVHHACPGDGTAIEAIAPYTRNQGCLDGRATAYVCRDFACSAPTTDPEEMLRSLRAGLAPRHDGQQHERTRQLDSSRGDSREP